MNAFDFIFLVLVGIGGWIGFRRGFIMSLFTLLGWLFGLYAGFEWNQTVSRWLEKPIGHAGWLPIASFFLLLLFSMLLFYFLGKWLKNTIRETWADAVDRTLGTLVGILKSVLFITTLTWLFRLFFPQGATSFFTESLFYPPIASLSSSIILWIASLTPSYHEFDAWVKQMMR